MGIGVLKDDCHSTLLSDLPEVNPANNTVPLSNNVLLNILTWTFLLLTLDRPPLMLIWQMPNQPYAAWTILNVQYEPTDTDAYTIPS